MTDEHALRSRLTAQAQTITGLNELLADMREVNRMMSNNIIQLRTAVVALRKFCHPETCTCHGCIDVRKLLATTEGAA